MVIAINDQEATARIITQARAVRSDLYILADTRDVNDIDALYQRGADIVIAQDFETSRNNFV